MSVNAQKTIVDARDGDDYWHRSINWENLRSIGSSPLASVSILMPFIGYAILYNDQIMTFLVDLGIGLKSGAVPGTPGDDSGSTNFLSSLSKFFELDLIVRLNLLYIGTVSVGVGTILFRLRAPKTIQRHSSIENFFNSELDRASARRLRTMVHTIKKRRPNVAEELIIYAPWLDREGSHSLALSYAEARGEGDQQIHTDVLSSFYNVESRYCNRKSAWVVLFLYALGILFLAIPGVFFTIQVLLSIFQ